MPPSQRPEHLLAANQNCGGISLRSLLEQMPALLWTTDCNLSITSAWGSGSLPAKVCPDELVGYKLSDFSQNPLDWPTGSPREAASLEVTPWRFEFHRWNRDFEVHVSGLRNDLGAASGYICVGLDITERRRDEEQNRYQATHDALTGLANYRQFLAALEHEVRRAERSNHPFALLLLDLNDLKRINDRWGHLAGNRALRRVSEVLKQQCRSADVPARYGGDEFAILLIDADPATARQIARRIDNALDRDREDPCVRVSIGISVFPENGSSARDLFEAADQDLYRNKKASSAHTAR